MATSDAAQTASFKVSTANASFFVDEVKGDLIMCTGAPQQRILIGNTSERAAMFALTSNDAVVHGNFASTSVNTNYVKSSGVELNMSESALIPSYANPGADPGSSNSTAIYDCSDVAAAASNQAFQLGTVVRSSLAVIRAEHSHPTVFSSSATFCGPINASNVIYLASNLTVGGGLTASDASTFSGPVITHGQKHTSNAAFFASNAAFLGDAMFSRDLTVYGNVNAMSRTYQHSNVVVYNNEEVRSNLAITGSVSASNASLTGVLRASVVDVTGAFTVNGVPMTLGAGRTSVSFSNCGTESAPLAGGNVLLNTSATSSAIFELTTTPEPLSITLDQAALFDASKLGKKGNLVLVERSTTGRVLTLDPRIHFPTNMNMLASGLNNTTLASTTLPAGFTTTAAPASGGIAIDTIDYYIPKPGFAIGSYYRQFKCMPPTFDEAALTGATHSSIVNAAAYTLDVASFLLPTYASYYGPLQYSLPPSTPSNVSIGRTSGVITVQQNTLFNISNIVLSIMGVTGVTTRTLAFDIKPWYAPVITDAAPGLPALQNTIVAAYLMPAPSMQYGTGYTGALVWSSDLTGLPAGTTFDTATGQLTFPQGSVFQGSVTLTATGPAPSRYTTSATFSVHVVNYQTPSIVAIASPQVGSTSMSAFSLVPQQTAGNSAGTLVWSLSPSSLLSTTGVTFDPSTGALGVASHTAINVSEVTITAMGPTGLSASRSFALSLTPWADPTFTTDYVTENHDTIASSYVLAGPTVQQSLSLTGTLVWSVTPSSLATYLNTTSGALTFPQHTSFPTGNVTLTATGPSGETESDTFALTIVPYATPVILPIANTTVYTGAGNTTITAVSIVADSGTISWSFDGTVPSGVSIDGATGVITVSKDTVFAATDVFVKATGPVTSIYGTTSFSLAAEKWRAPAIATIPNQTGDTSIGACTITPVQTMSSVGSLVWTLGPSALAATPGVSINPATGVVTIARYTRVSYSDATITATGPTGLNALATFSLTTVSYAIPVIATISDATVYTGASSKVVATATSATANTGAITWSLGLGAPSGVSIGATTGVITVSMGTVFSATSVTVVATTPDVTISGSKTFNLTAILWAAPVIATILTQTGDTTTSAYVITPSVSSAVAGASTGTLTWTLAPAGLASYVSSSTGVITIPIGIAVATANAILTATGPTSVSSSTNFSLTVTRTPTSLPGTVLYELKANSLSASPVSTWGIFSQSTSLQMPTWSATGGYNNGKYVNFAGTQWCNITSSLTIPMNTAGGFSFALLFKVTAVTTAGWERILEIRYPAYWPEGICINRYGTTTDMRVQIFNAAGDAIALPVLPGCYDTANGWKFIVFRYRKSDNSTNAWSASSTTPFFTGTVSGTPSDVTSTMVDLCNDRGGSISKVQLGGMAMFSGPLADADIPTVFNYYQTSRSATA